MERKALNNVLKHIKNGALRVTYWDDSDITYGTGEPLVHVTIHSPKAVRAMMRRLTLGFGESYMNELIDVDGPLDQINRLASQNKPTLTFLKGLRWVRAKNNNVRGRQRSQIAHHYDIGNNFYKIWLDDTMMYSCAYFKKSSNTLEQAQKQKI
ncbi:MAG TPA: class I SAM-dependent methyltransferase, partial [Candidatus Saccharimonadales bacterium]|nr:class I SAM-dependent methyltransferase [Candidatus Saccharimonadales bacterium]